MIIIDLIYNLAILVSLSILSGYLDSRYDRSTRNGQIIQGLLFGFVAVIGMMNPFVLSATEGVIFDGRSIVIGLCTFFFGPMAGVISSLIAIAYRNYLGGGGALTGSLVTTASFLIGWIYYKYHTDRKITSSKLHLYLMGLFTSAAMMALMFTLPKNVVLETFKVVTLTVMTTYPIITMVIGQVLMEQRDNKDFVKRLKEDNDFLQAILETTQDGFWIVTLNGRITNPNNAICKMMGYTKEEMERMVISDLDPFETPIDISKRINRILQNGSELFEVRHRKKNGEILFLEISASLYKDSILCFCRDVGDKYKAVQVLRDSEALYKTLVGNIPDVIMIFDKQLRHTYVSENVKKVVDIKPEEFIGKTHQELGFSDEDCSIWEKSINDVLISGLPVETEYSFESISGQVVHNWRLVPLRDNDGTVTSVLSISRDITRQRSMESDYKVLFNEMLDGFAVHEIICDESGVPIDYRFIAVNPAFERLTGLNAHEIIGRRVKEILPETEDYWIERYGKVALTGEPMLFEDYSSELKKYFEVKAFSPVKSQFACIFVDITKRKKAEISLKQSEERFQHLFERAPLGYQSLDENGYFIEVNEAWLNTLGYSNEEVVGKWFGDFLASEFVEAFRERFPVFKSQGKIHSEFEMIHKNGERRCIAFEGRIGYNNDGKFEKTHCILSDITDQKKTQIKNQEQLEELMRWQESVINREEKVIELKQEINRLLVEKGMPPRFEINE